MIESRLTCTQAQVAAFVAEHGGTRTASRKEAIDLALSAAAERARVRDVLRPNPDKSATGVLASGADFQRSGEVSVGSRPSSIPPPMLEPAAMPGLVPNPPPSGSIDVVVVDTPPKKGKVVLVAALLLVVGVAAGAAAMFFFATHHDPQPASSASVVAPRPTVSATSTIAIAPSATIDIPSVDPDSLPTAVVEATAKPQHSAGPTATAAPTDSATTTSTSRRSKYGF